MRRFLFFFIAVTFLLRGFMGDAMAVAMAHDVPSQQTVGSEHASSESACHEMAQDKDTAQDNTGSMSHGHCQLCCAVIAIPSTALLTFEQTAFFSRPIGLVPGFASNDLLPAFKPPIL